MSYLSLMFGKGTLTNGSVNFDILSNVLLFLILCIASTPYPKKLYYRLYEKYSAAKWIVAVGGIALLLICVAYLVNSSYNPFLYFRF